MKLRATTWLSVVLLALVLTVVGQSLHQKSPSKEEVERVRKLVLGDSFAYSNGTCQWQWASWETGGPPCPIRHHMKLLPLPKNNHLVNEILNLALLNVKAYVKYVINNVFPEIPIGITVGITYGQDYIYAEGTGVMNDTNTNPPNLDTIYDVGSITKIFTSLALFQTIQNGKTSLDDKVTNYFNEQSPPVFSIRNPYSNEGANAVTFRTLAAQSAGVPTDAFCGIYPLTTDCENNTLAAQMNMEALQNIGLKYLPGTGASYSNLGLSLLGRSLERIWDKQYESYMVEDLFLPLGMNSSGFVFTDEVMDRMITGYRATQLPNGTITGTVSNYNTVELGWCAPAGGLYTTANDIHQFYKTLFQLNGSSVINASTFVAFMAPGTFLRDGISMYGAGTFESAYAANYWTLTKGGLVDGFAGSLAIVPELNLGVSVFINTNSGFWASILSALITGEIQSALDYILPRIQEPSPLPPNYQSLLGTYGHALTNMVTMSEQANNTSGVLNGTINFLGSVYFVWDPELDIPSAGVTAFRYSLTQQPNSSCFIVQGSGNNGVAYFSVIKGVQTVTIADENLSFYALPKRPHRAAEQ